MGHPLEAQRAESCATRPSQAPPRQSQGPPGPSYGPSRAVAGPPGPPHGRSPVWRQDTLTPPLATSRTQSRTHARAKPYLADDLQLELSHFGWRTGENGGYLAPDGVHLKHGQALETEVQQGVQSGDDRASSQLGQADGRDLSRHGPGGKHRATVGCPGGRRCGPASWADHRRARGDCAAAARDSCGQRRTGCAGKAIAFFTKGTTR
jgi:hypothetical protein